MDKEKQIEEMARITANAIEETVCKKCEDCKWNGSGSKDASCTDYVCAEALYNAGYRKQSEGEWISVDERLPEPFVSVLEYMPGEMPHPTVREGFLNKRGNWYAGGFDRLPDEGVSWMKMPDAPKMKGGAE